MTKNSILKGIIIIIIVWFLCAIIIRNPVIPYPHFVFLKLIQEIKKGIILIHIGVSLLRIITGIICALILGIPIGIMAARVNKVSSFISSLLYLLYPVPKIAFLPVLMVLFGLGNAPKIIIVGVILFFPIAIAVRDGVIDLPKEYFQVGDVFKLTKKRIFLDIILPGILPRILSAVRISIGIGLSVLFFSENFATEYGIGYYIMNNWIMVNYTNMYVGIIFLSITGVSIYGVIDKLEKKIAPWLQI